VRYVLLLAHCEENGGNVTKAVRNERAGTRIRRPGRARHGRSASGNQPDHFGQPARPLHPMIPSAAAAPIDISSWAEKRDARSKRSWRRGRPGGASASGRDERAHVRYTACAPQAVPCALAARGYELGCGADCDDARPRRARGGRARRRRAPRHCGGRAILRAARCLRAAQPAPRPARSSLAFAPARDQRLQIGRTRRPTRAPATAASCQACAHGAPREQALLCRAHRCPRLHRHLHHRRPRRRRDQARVSCGARTWLPSGRAPSDDVSSLYVPDFGQP